MVRFTRERPFNVWSAVSITLRLDKRRKPELRAFETGTRNVITGASAHRSPYFNLVEMRPDRTVGPSKTADPPITRRQDAPRCFDMNASIYAWRVAAFLEHPAVFYPDTQLFEMPQERSVDIDSDLDFALVEFLLRRRQASESVRS